MFISGVNDTGYKLFGSVVSTTPLKNFSAMSLTLAINLCHRFSLNSGVVDTSNKFITGDNDRR
jgi:hypothetical protein